jgi:Glycosyl hydrolase family 81 C-terminal domain
MCGCDYDWDEKLQKGYCKNKFPNCPALTDMGQNFGAGFYNDHHFHFGYHIFAAGIIAKMDHDWGKRYYDRALLLVRDIANPSPQDMYFTTYMHKDWYVICCTPCMLPLRMSESPFELSSHWSMLESDSKSLSETAGISDSHGPVASSLLVVCLSLTA